MNNLTESDESTVNDKLADLSKEIQITAPARRVFQSLSTAEGLGKWWSYNTSGPNWDDGEVVLKWPKNGHEARVRLSEMKAPTFVEWSVIEHRPMKEWNGTAIRFSLEEAGSGETKVILQHLGLTAECECYEACSNAWGYLVRQLKKLLEQGFA
jgi:uncharacterized protein YndB with AHSA1/START domain